MVEGESSGWGENPEGGATDIAMNGAAEGGESGPGVVEIVAGEIAEDEARGRKVECTQAHGGGGDGVEDCLDGGGGVSVFAEQIGEVHDPRARVVAGIGGGAIGGEDGVAAEGWQDEQAGKGPESHPAGMAEEGDADGAFAQGEELGAEESAEQIPKENEEEGACGLRMGDLPLAAG